ncbi:MAG: glycine zipper 2TM domain-containing protein [Sphingobium sp.]|nr:glycine zipper 2TM domain-containing protein [Sphingobium sp.]
MATRTSLNIGAAFALATLATPAMASSGTGDRVGAQYDDDVSYGRPESRTDNGVGGAAVGAVVGGVAGNRIAGRGNRTAGTLVGAGAGAVAGAIIDKAEDRPRRVRHAPPPSRHGGTYDYAGGPGPAYDDDGVTYGGRWVGTWYGRDGTTYNGEYEGEYRGDVRSVTYDAPPERDPRWSGGPPPMQGGYVANGWYYPAPTVTTVTVQPGTTTTTTTTTYVTQTGRHRRHMRK